MADDFLAVAPSPIRPGRDEAQPEATPHPSSAVGPALLPLSPPRPAPVPCTSGATFVVVLSRVLGTVLLNTWLPQSTEHDPKIETTRLAQLLCAFQSFFKLPDRSYLRMTDGLSAVIVNGSDCCVAICGVIPDSLEVRTRARQISNLVSNLYAPCLAVLAAEEEKAEEQFATSKDIIAEVTRYATPREPTGQEPYTGVRQYVEAVMRDDSLSLVGVIEQLSNAGDTHLAGLWRQRGESDSSATEEAKENPTDGELLLLAQPPEPSAARARRRKAILSPPSGVLWPRINRLAAAAAVAAAPDVSNPTVQCLEFTDAVGGVLYAAARGIRVPGQKPQVLFAVFSPSQATSDSPGNPAGEHHLIKLPVVRCHAEEFTSLEKDGYAQCYIVSHMLPLCTQAERILGMGAPVGEETAMAMLLAAGLEPGPIIASAAPHVAKAKAVLATPPPQPKKETVREPDSGGGVANPLTKQGRKDPPAAAEPPDLAEGDRVRLAPDARSWGVLAGGAEGTVAERNKKRWKVVVGDDHDFYTAMQLSLVTKSGAQPTPPVAPTAPPATDPDEGDTVRLAPEARSWGVLAGGVEGTVAGRNKKRWKVVVGEDHDFYTAAQLSIVRKSNAPPAPPAPSTGADFAEGDTVRLAPDARSWGVLAGGGEGTITERNKKRWKVVVGDDHDFYMPSQLSLISKSPV